MIVRIPIVLHNKKNSTTMACWQLGEKEAARQHYNNAVGWIEKIQIDDEITLGFRNEAAKLLGIDIGKTAGGGKD